jgi:hypothetical protein
MCPKIKDALITEQTPIAPTYIINPPTVVLVTKILYDLFPLQRPKIHELIELASRQILGTKTRRRSQTLGGPPRGLHRPVVLRPLALRLP